MGFKTGGYLHCVLIIEKCDGTIETWDYQSDNQIYNPAKPPQHKPRNEKTVVVYGGHGKDAEVSKIAQQMYSGSIGHPDYSISQYNCCHWVKDVLNKAGIPDWKWKNPNPWPAN